MGQKFYANPNTKRVEKNGAVSFAPGGPFDCVGHYAKIKNCPVAGVPGLRLTAYASGYADTFFSVPACTRYRGQHIAGYFAADENGPVFHVMHRHAGRVFRVCHPDGSTDTRYALALEFCGEKEPRLILRFCGDWIGKAAGLAEAFEMAQAHKNGGTK